MSAPDPRWEELRFEIATLPERNDGTAGEWSLVRRSEVLRLIAAAPTPEPAIDVERLTRAMRRVLVPTLDDGDLAIAVPAIAAEYDRLGSE